MNGAYLKAVDNLKAMSILLVILTHSITLETRMLIGGPFWVDMAVPIFMILSGFTYSLSAQKKECNSITQYYTKRNIVPKFKRLLFSYLLIITIEVIIYSFFQPKGLKEIIIRYFFGGWGPGSYYIPLLFQLIILFPCMYIPLKKSWLKTVIFCFIIQITYDIAMSSGFLFGNSIANSFYRLFIGRHLVFIVMGIVLYFYKDRITSKKLELFTLSLLSLIFIIVANYTSYEVKIFKNWTVTSLPTIFWAMGLVIMGFKYLEKENKVFNLIGKASLHIFLIQMVYFNFLDKITKHFIMLPINILLCVFLGILFYFIELKITMSNKKFSLLN